MGTPQTALEDERLRRLRGKGASPKSIESDDMSVYAPKPEKRSEQLNARITKTIKNGLADVMKLWTHFDQVRFGDPDIVWSESDVVNQILEHGLRQIWAEIGFRPQTEAEWKEVFRRAEEIYGRAESGEGASPKKK